MSRKKFLRKLLRKFVFDFIVKLYDFVLGLKRKWELCFISKGDNELKFWVSRLEIDKGVFVNSHYRRLMLAMAEKEDDGFVSGKRIADFGCGPRGSLVWAKNADLRVGIDVLSDRYVDHFKSNIIGHDMMYLKSTEKVIPVPSGLFD